MSRSRNRSERAWTSPSSTRLCRVLPKISDSPLTRQGFSDIAVGRAAWRRHDRGDSARRWLASPLRAPRRVAQAALNCLSGLAFAAERDDDFVSFESIFLPEFVNRDRIRRRDEAGRWTPLFRLARQHWPDEVFSRHTGALCEAVFDGAPKVAGTTTTRRPHAVGVRRLPCVIRGFGLRRDEDGEDARRI